MQTKVCAICHETKSQDSFYESGNVKDGLGTYCKICDALCSKARRVNATPNSKANKTFIRQEERMRTTVSTVPELIKLAEEQGWEVQPTRSNHLRFFKPGCDIIIVSRGVHGRDFMNVRSQLRRAGLVFPEAGAPVRVIVDELKEDRVALYWAHRRTGRCSQKGERA